MPDAALLWGGDLGLSATGDLSLARGTDLGQQRVLRRLLTNAGDYMWHLQYGAGLGQFVGQAGAAASAQGVVYRQIFSEAVVSRQPAPVVTAAVADDGCLTMRIQYVDAANGGLQSLSFSMS
jgi:hypothetical protein